MCGRFSIVKDIKELESRFKITIRKELYTPDYNASPGKTMPVITNNQPDEAMFFRWGLVPFWAKDDKIGNKLINARSESLLEKPSFKNAFKRKRCLVPADGFYEWKKEKGGKQPYRITMRNNDVFAFAGLWDEWESPDGSFLCSFTIITTRPNDLMKGIHTRMPVILKPENEKDWLGDRNNPESLKELLVPYISEEMQAYQISTLVNSPSNNSPEIIKPIVQNKTLFD